MSEAPLRATLKSGAGYDAPWLGVDAQTPEELVERLNAVANTGVSEALINAANVLKAVNSAAPIAADVASPPQAAPAQPQGWGQPASPAPAPVSEPTWASAQPQQQAAPQQSKFGGPPHPEGKQCESPGCGKVLEHKKTSTGKATWRCPDWRWQNGNPNGHSSEWA